MNACRDCGAPLSRARFTLCRPCYLEARRAEGRATIASRLWGNVDSSAGPEGCWIWRGHRMEYGYGRISVDGRQRPAHKVAWEIDAGRPFPSGMNALHRCDNPPCCNPTHIYPGTQADNVRDMHRRGRWLSPTCPRGHTREWMRGTPGRQGRWCSLCYPTRRELAVVKP